MNEIWGVNVRVLEVSLEVGIGFGFGTFGLMKL